MATTQASRPKKRKQGGAPLPPDHNVESKRARSSNQPSSTHALITPHEPIIAELAPKYDVLTASVISSTQIRKRVVSTTRHLLDRPSSPAVVLLHARPADVCKLITIVEHCKRVLREEGKTCFQYNQLFELPAEVKKPEVVERTVLEGNEEDSDDDDDFEVMESRFEKAVLPPPSKRVAKSMRTFLSLAAVPELKAKSDVTLQACEAKKS